MKHSWHSVNTCLSIGFDIFDTNLVELKNWFTAQWPNRFNLAPHIGLLLLPLNDKSIDQAWSQATDYITNWTNPHTQITDLSIEDDQDEIFVSFSLQTDWLVSTHNQLLQILLSCRPSGTIRQKDIDRINSGRFNDQEIEHLYNYGFILNSHKYHPHITLGSIPKHKFNLQTETNLVNLTKRFINQPIKLTHTHLIFHTDAAIQSQMKKIKIQTFINQVPNKYEV